MRKELRVFVYLLGALAVLLLQVLVVWLSIFTRQQMAFISQNQSFMLVLLAVLAGIISGMILSLLLFSAASRKFPIWQTALLGIIPMLAVVEICLRVFGKDIMPGLISNPYVREWMVGPVPALWLGLVLGRVLQGSHRSPDQL